MRKILFVLTCFWPLFLLLGIPSEIQEDRDVATTEGLPSSLVNNSVSVITGEYTDSAVDMVIPGPEPMVIDRFYSSSGGWTTNKHRDRLILGNSIYKNDIPVWIVALRQPSGSQFDYICHQSKNDLEKKRIEFELVVPKGLTNGASCLSGRTNTKNQTVSYFPEEKKVLICTGAGHRRIFEKGDRTDEGWLTYSLKEEEKGKGCIFKYECEKGLKIACRNKKSKKEYSHVNYRGFDGKESHLKWCVKASDDREIFYHFFRHKYRETEKYKGGESRSYFKEYFLSKVDTSYAPKEEYSYEENERNKSFHLVRKDRPDDRFLKIDYYHLGTNHLGGELDDISIDDDDHYRLDRVRKLQAPVGHDETPITIYRFDYHSHVRKHDSHHKIMDGYTDVYDAENHKTRYTYDKEHRLTSIMRYEGTSRNTYRPYSEECYLWNDEGYLSGKIFKDGKENVHHARYFTYDKHGNVKSSTLCGKLTGHPSADIILDKSDNPIENGYERDCKTYTYTKDGLNLLEGETFSNGKSIQYEYKKDTDLLKAKYVYDHKTIKLREFYFYDEDNLLVEKITDDGNDLSFDNLSEVTERHFTTITQRKEAPFGFPESVEEGYLCSGKKVPLKRSEYKFSAEGRKEREKVYDALGNLRYTLKWQYDLHGNVTEERNAIDQFITREYDDNDNLIKQHGPSTRYSIENEYDNANRLIKQKEFHGEEKFVVSHKYDYLGNCLATTNAYGHETIQEYDDFNRLIKIRNPLVLDENGNLTEPVIKKDYDIAGYPILLVDPTKGKTHIEYNIRGQPVKITYPDETVEQMFYNTNGELVEKIAKNGTSTLYERDYLGRIIRETQQDLYGNLLKQIKQEYNAFHLLRTIDPEGDATTYSYDKAGRLISTSKNRQLQQNFYDELGRIIEVRDFNGYQPQEYQSTKREYDLLNRITKEDVSYQETLLLSSRFDYDPDSGSPTITQKGDQKTTTEYDSHSQPIKITNGLGHVTHIKYNYHFKNQQDQQVLQTITTDPLGYRTIDTYDTANRLAETVRKNPFNQKVGRREIYYDLRGNQCRLLDEVIEGEEVKRVIETCYSYTPNNQIEELKEANRTDEQKITRKVYENGQEVATIKPDGTALIYEYDSLNRLKTLQSSDQTIAYQYDYNGLDQAILIEDMLTNQKTIRDYKHGQLEQETLANGLSLNYTYNRMGKVRTIQFPDKTGVEYIYNATHLKEVHRLINKKRTYTHRNQKHSLSGQVTQVLLPGDNGVMDFTYDTEGHCTAISSPLFQQTVPDDGFDAAGNLLKYHSQGLSYNFAYDDHYHLKSENDHTYSYDSLSNRTSKDGETIEHNSLNQIVKDDDFIYRNGNLIERKGKHHTLYTYDALDRLTSITQNGKTTQYSYDSFNRRLSKKCDDQQELFFYQGQEEIGLWKEGAIQELRLLGSNTRNPMVALELKGTPYIPIHDISGNVTCLLTLQGQVVERYRYTAFGDTDILSPSNEKLPTSSLKNPWQFASKRLDPESGLIAFGLRYYDPSLGRWITSDPAGFEDGPNLYAYVHYNPLTYYDQFGLWGLHDSVSEVDDVYQRLYVDNCVELDYQGVSGSPVKHISIESQLSKVYPYRCRAPYANQTATYCINDFVNKDTEEHYNFKPLPPNTDIFHINGILTDFDSFKANLLHLADLSGGYNVKGIFCPTFGTPLDCLFYHNTRDMFIAYEGVRELQKLYANFDEKSIPGASMLGFPHSRGCAYTYNSLLDSPQHIRERVEIIAIAPGKYFEDSLCKRVWHYRTQYDIVPQLDRTGKNKCKHNTTVLKSAPGTPPIFDHFFTSATCSKSIRIEIEDYFKRAKR